MKKALLTLTAVMMMFSLFGCGKSKQFDIATYRNAEEKTMLVDYFERTVGTPMEMPYYEIVLYTKSDTQALLEEYTEGGTENETVTSCLIPIDAAQEILTTVQKTGMASWNSRNGVGICGKSYVCKFPDGKDGYIRVTSDNMPKNGTQAFGEVAAVMRKWMKDEYPVEK